MKATLPATLLLALGCATGPEPARAPAPPPSTEKAPAAVTAAPALPSPGATAPIRLPPSTSPLVAVQLRFRSGAVDDPPGEAGITHLAARVMTEGGTQALTSQQVLTALFPFAAELSARVDKEETTFSMRVPKDGLSAVVGILTDVVAHPRWDAREFARLRTAVVNDIEKRLRQGDDENLGKEALSELLYRGHPYERLTLGHVSDLRTLTLEQVKAHAARVFSRDRLSIGVADGYPEDLPSSLESALAALPGQGVPAVPIPVAAPHGPRVLLVQKQTASTAISIGTPWTLWRGDPDWAAMSVARSAFGEHRQFSGRLMQRLRGLRGLNYGDYAYLEHFVQEGGDAAAAQTGRVRRQQEFTIWLRPVQNENALFATRAALNELQKSLSSEPFAEDEVTRTKGFLDGYLLLFDQTDARRLGYALDDQFLGLTGFLEGWRKAVLQVSPVQVNAAWRKWIRPEALRIVIVTPNAEALKKEILANAPSPVAYARDAQGNTPAKPQALTDEDARVAQLPLGVKGPDDVQIVPVEQLFQ